MYAHTIVGIWGKILHFYQVKYSPGTLSIGSWLVVQLPIAGREIVAVVGSVYGKLARTCSHPCFTNFHVKVQRDLSLYTIISMVIYII